MHDPTIETASRLEHMLYFAACVLALLAVLEISAIKPWMWANPPPELCRPLGVRPTPQTEHIPTCPRVERRASKETTT